MGKGFTPKEIDGKGLRVGIITARWNEQYTTNLRNYTYETLRESGVEAEDVIEMSVPGSFELPFACQKMLDEQNPDVIIAIGVLIKGETMHFEYIAEATTKGIMDISLVNEKPIIFGVLTCLTEEQVGTRAGEDDHNHGIGWAKTAIEMATLETIK